MNAIVEQQGIVAANSWPANSSSASQRTLTKDESARLLKAIMQQQGIVASFGILSSLPNAAKGSEVKETPKE